MALVFCPDCGKEVSDSATNCPNCSYPITKLRNNNTTIYKINELIIVGYIAIFLSIFIFPIFFMLIGIILGVVNLTRGSIGHGILQIILSIIFGILGAFIGILAFLF